jgi:predicted HicB family RNase H-like nuclease
MKRIIGGQTYNTDTATEVFSESAPEPSMGWWALYQTRHNAFFKVVVDHDGESTMFTPLSDADAQALLEKRANHLVEQYFGSFPEYGAAERRLTIRVPGNLADRLEAAAQTKGLSLNSYAMRCFERCAAEDGQAAERR